jgi:hypothetical protein
MARAEPQERFMASLRSAASSDVRTISQPVV